jgi:preprotein translocase SecE subunit
MTLVPMAPPATANADSKHNPFKRPLQASHMTGASGHSFSSQVLASVELRKMVWPTRQATVQTTLVVFVFVILMGIFFWLVDMLLAWATRYLTGQGG